MEVTQSFRLPGKTDIIEIPCDNVDGQNIVHWVDIEQIFPGVKYVKRGNIAVTFMKEAHLTKSIKHFPDVVLDVVLFDENDKSTSGRSSYPKGILNDTHTVESMQMDTPALSNQSSERFVAAVRDLKHSVMHEMVSEVKKLITPMINLQDEMKHLQIQALDRLALLQKSVKGLRTQIYELHEYPIPRFFVVLPDDQSPWNFKDFFANKFRLHFFCECDENTESTNNRNTGLHPARHDGYDIAQPKVFFQKYGPYVLWILKILRSAVSVAGSAVPGLTPAVGLGMAKVIEHLEKVSEDEGEAMMEFTDQKRINEALEGADLRQLESFLKKKDECRVLGNLFRTVTEDGHVKWVCLDHYRQNYQENDAITFRDTVEGMGGTFDENVGRVEVTLLSKVQAEQFYRALVRARAVYELHVVLNWKATRSDFKRLRDTLKEAGVRILELDLASQDGSSRDAWKRSERHNPVFDIMRNPKIQTFTIIRPHDDFVRRSHQLPPHNDFIYLKRLEISLSNQYWDSAGVRSLVSKAPRLESLILNDAPTDLILPVYIAIAGHQTYPITFNSQSLCIPPPPPPPPPPPEYQRQSTTAHHCMARLLGVNSEWIDSLEWSKHEQAVVDAFAEATENGSKLRWLKILSTDRMLSDKYAKSIARIVASSRLQRLEIALKADWGRVRILESIQWNHLRELMIETEGYSLLMSLRALANGVKRVSGTPVLDEFRLYQDSNDLLPEIDEPLQVFVASISLIELQLEVDMTFQQVHSLVKSVDVSRLVILNLRAKGFCSTEVDTILDRLQCAKLLILCLRGAKIVNEQRERMEVKGTSLSS